MVIDYKKVKIYKIVSKNPDIKNIYVGHTTYILSTRFAKHKATSKLVPNLKLYKFINENGGWGNFEIILLEEFKTCQNIEQAKQKEEYYRKLLNADLNTYTCIGIDKNKQNQNKRKWVEKNPEKRRETLKKY